jgi:ornithine cyclodeaminase/alanine dehydrogenase-like protein (mu-crystallin family)
MPAASDSFLYLTGHDVAELLHMDAAIELVEAAWRAEAQGQAASHPRYRMKSGGALMHVLGGTLENSGVLGVKTYVTTKDAATFAVLLFSAKDSRLLAVIEADRLGQIRTGAASGVATRHMARPDANIAAIIGSGWQARAQLEAIAAVRTLREARVYSRSADNRQQFATEMGEKLGLNVKACDSVEAAVLGAHIISTATSAKEPVLFGRQIAAGAHINAMGSNAPGRREIDGEAVLRAAVIATDLLEQARVEAGDLIPLVEAGRLHWDQVVPMAAIVAGKEPGRRSMNDVTIFKSHGVAIEDLTVAEHVWREAVALGCGTSLPRTES